MQNQEFYIKYLDNRPVGLKTHILNTNSFIWIQTLFTVGDLIGAYKTAVAPRFDSTPVDELTLHLPDGFDRSALQVECFFSIDETDKGLRSGLALTKLNGLGLTDLNPLIVKSKTDANQGILNIN
jgi:hypothetical protein